MRIIFRLRSLRYLFLRKYWGIREGSQWVYSPEIYAYMIDLGLITIGYAV